MRRYASLGLATLCACVMLAAPALAEGPGRDLGDRIDRHLDRIDRRLDRRGY
jgi:hypothetical protein